MGGGIRHFGELLLGVLGLCPQRGPGADFWGNIPLQMSRINIDVIKEQICVDIIEAIQYFKCFN